MATTMVNIGVKEIMAVMNIRVRNIMAVDIRVETLAVDIGDSLVYRLSLKMNVKTANSDRIIG